MGNVVRIFVLFVCLVVPVLGQFDAELIYFTDDGTQTGTSLSPGFLHHSCWSGIGASSAGNIYIAASNHQQPGGNVALYKYNPTSSQMSLLGDIKSTSQHVDNWMPDETQHKVHSFLMEHADGKIYFASDDYAPSPFLRGAHLYYIDPVTDSIVDFSKTQPFLMDSSFNVITNTGQNTERSGVFIEFYGIKGISLNPRASNLIYAMTYPGGHIIKYDLSDGSMAKVGVSNEVSYVFYTANNGDIYYASLNGSVYELKKYDLSAQTTSVIAADIGASGWGMMAPTASGDICYLLNRDKNVYRLDCRTDQLTFLATFCGTNWGDPGLFNMTLNSEESRLYITTLSAETATKATGYIDLWDSNRCYSSMHVVGPIVGNRSLAFGGVNTWDKYGNYYLPVWEYGEDNTLALLKVTAPQTTTAIENIPGQGMVAHTISDEVRFRTNPLRAGSQIEIITTQHGIVDVVIYSVTGVPVKTLVQGEHNAGRLVLNWDGTDTQGAVLANGVYYARLNNTTPVRFMIAQ